MKTKAKARYRLYGNIKYEAEKMPGRKDECGQSPYKFVTGPWKGKTVHVEPHKMEKVETER